MPWYALDAVDDALESTRQFLFPFRFGRWLRLAVIVFFLGGGGSGGGLNGVVNVPPSTPGPGPSPGPGEPIPPLSPGEPLPPGVPPIDLGLVLAVVGIVVAVGLLFAVLSSVMRFVLLDALRTGEVRVRDPFRRRFGKGIRLFAFQAFVAFLAALPFILVGVLVLAGVVDPASLAAGIGAAGAVLLAPVALVVGLLVALFLQFTVQFVAPVMIATDGGVLASWRRFWPTLRAEPAQFLAFVVVRFLLGIGVGIAVGLLVALLGAIIAVAGFVAALVVTAALGGFSAAVATPIGIGLYALIAAVALLALLAVSLPIQILVRTYFTTYELRVLGSANARFALLPPLGSAATGGAKTA
ncbi:DUF7544 domain-containing protein [Halegenticoccus soli]|uniref:DUF7544 domain-containing protein n=1 Tax=Halegenticoccus soli TaxID=1985678 RepID=UPI000C6E14EB|nr:hypothetical protein [Halegenticoccus soli]